jgi:hypothetical protein
MDAGHPCWLPTKLEKKKKKNTEKEKQWPVINIQIYFSVVTVRSSWDENNGGKNGVGG